MSSFIPEGYKIPQAPSQYLKLEEGTYKLRILSEQPFIFYEYFTTDDKPVLLKERPAELPANIKPSKYNDGKKEISEVWGLAVYNHDLEQVQILKITQVSIKRAIIALAENPDCGNPTGYDITITREKDKSGKTTYAVIASVKSREVPADALAKAKTIKLSELAIAGGKPFDGAEEETIDSVAAEIEQAFN